MAYLRRLPSGRWQATVRYGKRRIYGPNPPALLKKEAADWAREQETAIARGHWRDPRAGRVMFDEWFERWWDSRVVEPEGARDHRYTVDLHILPYWSGKPLPSIGRLEVQTWIARMQKAGKGAPLIAKAYGIFRTCMLAAVDEELIPQTPCRSIELPVVPKRKPRFFEVDEVRLLVDELPAHHAAIAELMAWCGPRWEEAAAVEVEHINALRREVDFAQVITSMRRVKFYSKNTEEHRVVPAPAHVLERLTPFWRAAVDAEPYVQHYLDEDGKQLRAPTTHRLLFRAADGRPLSPQSWQMAWKRAHQRLAARPVAERHARPLRYFPANTLRHTAASWWVQHGVDLYEVGRLLGHSKADTTQIYAHLRPGVHRNVQEAWRNLLASGGATNAADATVTHVSQERP